ncbi:MAG: putative teichuronic acid biosynthesis glycosyltransferase TuaC [Pelotomaculum sp. PtaB.Bin104]|nr:MAG: putative teichuronic acid biosynthesis glycosyltransferase TuaC [Pelotomaculum sp. PtaB.Bin104]
MKVLFLSPTFPNRYNPNYGIFAFQLVQNLQASNISFNVIAPVPYSPPFLWFKKKWREQAHIPKKEWIKGVEIFYPRYLCLPGKKFIYWNTLFMYWSVYPVLKKLHGKVRFNIMHSYGVLPAGYVGQLTAEKLGLSSTCTAIGLDINMLAQKSIKAGALARYVLENTGQVIAVGKDLAAEINKLYVPDKMIKVIYNGIDSERFNTTNIDYVQARIKLGLSPDVRIILFVGRLVREKGIYELLEVFNRVLQNFSEAILVIVGDGNEKEALMNLAGEKGIQDKITFTGSIPHKDLVWWYAASEIVILLSYYEGVPNVLKEAMSCGRAVLATSTVGITELVVDGETGLLVEPGNVEQAVAALEKLLAEPKLSRDMGINARRLIQEKQLSWEKTAKAYQDVYLQQLQ